MDKHYHTMWQQGMAAYQQQKFVLDNQIADPGDSRRGITLLARLSQPIKNKTSLFLTELDQICPGQYCYPKSDLHVTILSIVSCQSGYLYDEHTAQQYLSVLAQTLTDIPSFTIDFSGITVSDASVLLTGFGDQIQLAHLRQQVREAIMLKALPHNMDSRYKISTAHSTIMRYQSLPKDRQLLIRFLQANQYRQFGAMQVDSLELVFNDWYQTEKNTQTIGIIKLMK